MRIPSLGVTLAILIGFLPVLTGESNRVRIDDRSYYRLTNTYLGEAYSLDTTRDAPNAPVMAKSGDYAGQYWLFTPQDGCYRLTNMYLGADRSLDTYSDGENAPFLGKSGPESGQRWHVTDAGDGYVKLTNEYLGNSRSLDTHSGSGREPFMGETGNYSGQLWKLTRVSHAR